MVDFNEHLTDLKQVGITVVAASIDPLDKAKEVADELNFPIGYEVTRADADKLGAWWEDRRQIIQPSEFILDDKNVVVGSSYSDGPLGRTQAMDVIAYTRVLERRKAAS